MFNGAKSQGFYYLKQIGSNRYDKWSFTIISDDSLRRANKYVQSGGGGKGEKWYVEENVFGTSRESPLNTRAIIFPRMDPRDCYAYRHKDSAEYRRISEATFMRVAEHVPLANS